RLPDRHVVRRVARRHAVRRQPLRGPLCRAARQDRPDGSLERQRRVAPCPGGPRQALRRPALVRENRAMHRKKTSPLRSHGRYAYSAITRRPDYSWPGRKRLAVYIGFNLEHFSFGEGMGAALGPRSPEPDVLNYSWRDYGNRVGAWRCLELFEQLRLPVGVLVNTALYDYCPDLVAAFVKRGDELIGHGHTNSVRQGDMSAAAERKLLRECRERIRKESGRAPSGW